MTKVGFSQVKKPVDKVLTPFKMSWEDGQELRDHHAPDDAMLTITESSCRGYRHRWLTILGWLRRARTNFNSLELMCSMPDDAQVILDAMREGKGQREAARQHMGGGGLISQVVASALGQLPNAVDSSTQEGKHRLCLLSVMLGLRSALIRQTGAGVRIVVLLAQKQAPLHCEQDCWDS